MPDTYHTAGLRRGPPLNFYGNQDNLLVRPEMVNANSEQAPQILPSYLLLPQTGAPLLLVGWTLVYEMFFYAIFALGLLIGRRYLPVLLVAWALALVAARLVLGRPDDPWISFLTNPINLEFLFGVTIGYLTIRGRLRAPRTAVAVGLIAALAVWTVQVNQGREASGEWFRALCVGGAMAVIIYGVVALELANGRRFPKLMHQLGDASYSIYLWHLLALKALGLVLEKIVPDHSAVHVVSAALSFAVIVAACVIAYRVIEDPLMRGLRNRIPKPNAQYIKVRRFE